MFASQPRVSSNRDTVSGRLAAVSGIACDPEWIRQRAREALGGRTRCCTFWVELSEPLAKAEFWPGCQCVVVRQLQ